MIKHSMTFTLFSFFSLVDRLSESNWITVEDKTHIFHVLALKNHSLYEFKITYENDHDVYLIDEIATDIAFAYYTNSARDRLILSHNGNYIINRQSNELLISDHLSGQFIQHISGYRDDKLIIETTTHYYLFDGSEWIETLEKKSDHIYLKSLIQVIDEDYYFAYYSLCQNVISLQRIKL